MTYFGLGLTIIISYIIAEMFFVVLTSIIKYYTTKRLTNQLIKHLQESMDLDESFSKNKDKNIVH